MDILEKVYESLLADPLIKEQANGRIKFYEYPETGEIDNPHIVIDLLDAPTPTDYADGKWTKLDYLIQIDVRSKNRKITDSIADRIRAIMWGRFGFAQRSGPKEYDEGVFRDARRYRGTLYREDFEKL